MASSSPSPGSSIKSRPAASAKTVAASAAREHVVLIGEEPGPGGQADCPLYPLPGHCAGGRLRELTGLSLAGYLRAFDRTNLGWRNGSTDEELRAGAWAVRPFLAGRRALLLGRRVVQAFELGDLEPLTWVPLYCGRGAGWRPTWTNGSSRCSVAYFPHPSGRNRWFNDEANAARAQLFLRRL